MSRIQQNGCVWMAGGAVFLILSSDIVIFILLLLLAFCNLVKIGKIINYSLPFSLFLSQWKWGVAVFKWLKAAHKSSLLRCNCFYPRAPLECDIRDPDLQGEKMYLSRVACIMCLSFMTHNDHRYCKNEDISNGKTLKTKWEF